MLCYGCKRLSNRIYGEISIQILITKSYSNFHGKSFFKMAYDELFQISGIYKILYQDGLEADCIALIIKEFKKIIVDFEPTIITADHDYMQLIDDDIKIMTMKYKIFARQKTPQ